jgi:serine/threonine-protein kinase
MQPASDRESRLALVLADLTDRIIRGERPRLEAELERHADLAAELRELWPTLFLAHHLGSSVSESQGTGSISDPAPFPRVMGDFELLEELGRGGMGVVYRAWQKSLQRSVAIKMILRGSWASPEELQRFQAEAEAAAGLSHPHIVPIYESGVFEGQPYFTMKYVAGTTLASLVAQQGPLPSREAAHYVGEVARAVQHAHSAGLLHRDLKPTNVLLDREGRMQVTDFGLAKRVRDPREPQRASKPASLTQSGAVVGTPSYMAPEQAAGTRGELSPCTDVYGLGALLYFLITGRPPFQAETHVDTIMLVLEQEPLPPRLLHPGVDRELEQICLKCLEKSPIHRYPTAAALAEDLEHFLRDEATSVRSWSFIHFLGYMLRPTHHEPVLENWGLLWMWHSMLILFMSAVTIAMYELGVTTHWPYLALWSVGLVVWGAIFWQLRQRDGPVTFVERQIAHGWAGGVLGSAATFSIEWGMDLPVLSLAPVLAAIMGIVFTMKGGILGGSFYISAAVGYVAALVMPFLRPPEAIGLFGVIGSLTFFIPGLKYYRQRRKRAECGKRNLK